MPAEFVLDLITAAMEHATVLGQGVTPSPEDQVYCFGRLNNIVDGWNAEEGMLYSRPQANYVLTSANGGPYGLGPGGSLGSIRPALIMAANIQPAGTGLSLSLDLLTTEDYAGIEDKFALSVRPERLHCDYNSPIARSQDTYHTSGRRDESIRSPCSASRCHPLLQIRRLWVQQVPASNGCTMPAVGRYARPKIYRPRRP